MIRLATLADVPALVAMGQEFAQTPEYAGILTLDPQTTAAMAGMLIVNEDALVLVESGEADEPIGMLALLLTPHLMSGELLALEVVWWVQPGRRQHGVQMLREAERWARERGATALQLIAPTVRVEQFYHAIGYQKVEVAYQKRLT